MQTMLPSSHPRADVALRRISSRAEPAFDALLSIYAEAIPESERKSAAQLAAMALRPEYCFLAALEDSAVVGFSIAASLRGTDAALLEYLAVAQQKRGRGIGAWLFRATIAQPQIVGKFLLVEVDSDCTDSPDNAARVRRKAFYRRLGAKQIGGLSYRMPRVSNAAPPPMELLVYAADSPALIERSRLRTWLEGCYAQVYGMPADDPQIEAMLDGLPAWVALI